MRDWAEELEAEGRKIAAPRELLAGAAEHIRRLEGRATPEEELVTHRGWSEATRERELRRRLRAAIKQMRNLLDMIEVDMDERPHLVGSRASNAVMSFLTRVGAFGEFHALIRKGLVGHTAEPDADPHDFDTY